MKSRDHQRGELAAVLSILSAVVIFVGMIAVNQIVQTDTRYFSKAALPGEVNVALNKPVIEHIGEVTPYDPNGWVKIVDGDHATSWLLDAIGARAVVDLQAQYDVKSVRYKLTWDTSVPSANTAIIQILGSTNNSTWVQVDRRQISSTGNFVDINLATPTTYRYIKLYWENIPNTVGARPWGNIFELEVYATQPTPSSLWCYSKTATDLATKFIPPGGNVSPGQIFHYIIRVANDSNTSASGVQVLDQLPKYIEFDSIGDVPCTVIAPATATTGQQVRCDIVSIAGPSQYGFYFKVKVRSDAPAGSSQLDEASVLPVSPNSVSCTHSVNIQVTTTTTPTPSPSPTTPAPYSCQGLISDFAPLTVGSTTALSCFASLAPGGLDHANFRYSINGGTTWSSTINRKLVNETAIYNHTYQQTGSHIFQCQICRYSNDSDCTAWGGVNNVCQLTRTVPPPPTTPTPTPSITPTPGSPSKCSKICRSEFGAQGLTRSSCSDFTPPGCVFASQSGKCKLSCVCCPAIVATLTPTRTPTPSRTPTPTRQPTNTPRPGCPDKDRGDADCDDRITLTDYEDWRKEFLNELSTLTADFNKSGKVAVADFDIWRGTYTSQVP